MTVGFSRNVVDGRMGNLSIEYLTRRIAVVWRNKRRTELEFSFEAR